MLDRCRRSLRDTASPADREWAFHCLHVEYVVRSGSRASLRVMRAASWRGGLLAILRTTSRSSSGGSVLIALRVMRVLRVFRI